MRIITAFVTAFGVAAAAFITIMLTTPPVSEARMISSIDTYALTLSAPIAASKEYDCN